MTTYDGTDFYCDVASPDPGALRVVHDDDRVLAFHHTRPFWQVHVVVIPKRHIGSLTTVTAEDEADVRARGYSLTFESPFRPGRGPERQGFPRGQYV